MMKICARLERTSLNTNHFKKITYGLIVLRTHEFGVNIVWL